MQRNCTCPNCGAGIADDATPAPDIDRLPKMKEHAARLGPPVVEHQCRDSLGRPFGVAGIDDVDIPVTNK